MSCWKLLIKIAIYMSMLQLFYHNFLAIKSQLDTKLIPTKAFSEKFYRILWTIRHHPLSTYVKFSEKLTFLTPWCVLNGWPLIRTLDRKELYLTHSWLRGFLVFSGVTKRSIGLKCVNKPNWVEAGVNNPVGFSQITETRYWIYTDTNKIWKSSTREVWYELLQWMPSKSCRRWW